MIRHLTLSFAAFGFMIAAADAAQMPSLATPAKPGIAIEAPHAVTGRSAWHRHWHRHHHWHHHR